LRDDTRIIVTPALVAGIHDFVCSAKSGWPGTGERKRRVLRTARPGHDDL